MIHDADSQIELAEHPAPVRSPNRWERRRAKFGLFEPIQPAAGRSNRSDARPGKTERAKRVRKRRRAVRAS